jgi:hypothetical protein
MLLDGAHTPASLASCARWFHAAAVAPAAAEGPLRRVRVLVFNTTGGRRDAALLEPLVAGPDGAWAGGGAGGFDVVLFCPNDSSVTVVTGAASSPGVPAGGAGAGSAGGDVAAAGEYAWQEGLLEGWRAARTALRLPADGAEGTGGAGSPAGPVSAGEDGQALAARAARAVRAGSGEQVCVVAGSVGDALGVVRLVGDASLAAGGGGVTALVTGSLYLVGDVLARTGAHASLEAL